MIRRPASDRPKRLFRGNWHASSLIGIAASVAIVGTALAGWAGIGVGAGFAMVSTLGATTVTATATAGGANLTWASVPAPGGSTAVSYYVQRDGSDASGSCPTSSAPTGVTSCADAGIGRGTYSYTVTAVFHSWTAASAPVSVGVASGALSQFHVTVPSSSLVAGVATSVTISAWDASGVVVQAYTGSHCLTFAGPGNSPNGTAPAYPPAGPCSPGDSYVAFSNGVATVPVTLYAAGSPTLHVTDPSGHTNGAGLHVDVQGGSAKSFTIPTPGTQTAGVAFNISISSKDAYGNTASAYTGTYCVTFSGPGASPSGQAPTYPARGSCGVGQSAITFASGSAASIPITLYNPAATVLTATDSAAGAAGSTGTFTVLPGGAASFAIADPGPRTAGAAFTLTISAMDGYGSVATNYTGTKCVAFGGASNSPNGAAPTYPAQGTCAAGLSAISFASGVGTAQVTLVRAGPTALTATAGALTGTSPTFVVNGSAISRFTMAAATTTPAAGAADNLTITAVDGYGNTANGYVGAHALTFSGATAVPNSPFTPNVSNAAGAAVNFGTATSITFSAGIASVSGGTNGVMRLYRTGTFNVVVSDGTASNGAGLAITVHAVAVSIGAGGHHTCAVLSYGGVECWGRNTNGQLGNNSTVNSATPVAVSNITTAVSVTGGQDYTCAVLADATARCWGLNSNGQLGNNSITSSSVPVTVTGLSGVVAVSAGTAHTCAVVTGGGMRCWGDNGYGQLGNNSTTDSRVPVTVQSAATATSISAGMYHTCALTSAGVQCWGDNDYYEIGDGTNAERHTPVTIPGISAISISAGWYHTCAVLANHSLDCWGRNNDGQLGDGTYTTRRTPTPVLTLTTGALVSGGRFHTCAALTSGQAWCWGYNDSGQLGDNSTTTRLAPVQSGTLATVTQIDSGGDNSPRVEHSVALLADGSVASWGDNTYGQLGDLTTTDRHLPVATQLQ